jgi:hypothetical protein
MSNLIHNERVKLRAAFVNNVGVACFVVGCVAPLITRQDGLAIMVGLLGAFCLGLPLAAIAHAMLGELKE